MIIYALLAVVVFLAGLACWSATLRIAARSYAPLVAILVVLLAGAGLCAAISEVKTGGFLSGIVGYLFGLGLLCIASGLVLGAVLRLAWRWLGREDSSTLLRPAPTPAPWDLIGFSALALIAVVLSALE
ncbi:hypothetical protein [Paracoccus lutimaris]|uniref:Uncharacterized protein n=1 Tax=Paracoccus lutimaris TaxID=1490030 RepID=A0A368YHS0_9RHOB|nr:hypothetical protein [Paracoccus lutimaris]RCW79715.1 hypothetical protein DFP89_12346 [Paracoccus lutimaris]